MTKQEAQVKEKSKKVKKQHCFSCGCMTGPDYLEGGFKYKEHNLCGSCLTALKRRGYCVVSDDAFLMETGEIVTISRKDRDTFLQEIHERRKV